MAMLGFSINILTLFGLVLAIGIVVDDAIIVIENVERIMATEHVGVVQATDKAMTQVSGALIAIVLVLAAVFIPGRLHGWHHRRDVHAVRRHDRGVRHSLGHRGADAHAGALHPAHQGRAPDQGAVLHLRSTTASTASPAPTSAACAASSGGPKTFLAAFAVILVLIVFLFKKIPGGFVPTEDKGYFALAVNLPAGASRQRSDSVVAKIERIVASKPGVKNVISLVGFDYIMNANLTNIATMFVMLEPWEERKDEATSIGAIIGAVNRDLSQVPEATAFAFNLPEISGMGTTAGLEMNLLDRSGGSVKAFAGLAQEYVAAAGKSPDVSRPRALISVNTPQVYVNGGPGKGEEPRRVADRRLPDPADDALRDVHQRLQSVRTHLPRAGRGAAAVPDQPGGHRPALRVGPGRGDGARSRRSSPPSSSAAPPS